MPLLVLVAPQGVALIGLLAVMEGAEPGQIGNRCRSALGEGNQMVDLQEAGGPAPGHDTTGIPVSKGGEEQGIDRPGEVEDLGDVLTVEEDHLDPCLLYTSPSPRD